MLHGIEQRRLGQLLGTVLWTAPRLGELELSSNLGELPEHTGTIVVLIGQTHPGREKSVFNNSMSTSKVFFYPKKGKTPFFPLPVFK